ACYKRRCGPRRTSTFDRPTPDWGPSVKSLARAIRSPRFLGLFACIAIASILAAPTVVFCPRGLASCELAINRLGSTGDSRFFAGAWEATRVALVDFHQ